MPEPTYVRAERELESFVSEDDTAALRVSFDARNGSEALEQRLLRFAPGRSRPRGLDFSGPRSPAPSGAASPSPSAADAPAPSAARDEALFVVEGTGSLLRGGVAYPLEPATAVRVAPDQPYEIDNPGPGELALVSVLVPVVGEAPAEAPVVVRLADQDARAATSERAFQILLDPARGLTGGTLFVGVIPTKRAPEHYHHYDEVIYVLEGDGLLHVGGERTPIGPSSCIHLRPRLRHCLENTGDDDMRVLALFRPAGDPSEAYLPDGERAVVDAAPQAKARAAARGAAQR